MNGQIGVREIGDRMQGTAEYGTARLGSILLRKSAQKSHKQWGAEAIGILKWAVEVEAIGDKEIDIRGGLVVERR